MATYDSYKKIIPADQIDSEEIVDADLEPGAGFNFGVQYIFNERGQRCHLCSNAGGCCCMQCGRCCLWTVPDKTTSAIFEIWSGGGGGAGISCSNCCSFSIGGAGGNYAVKRITTVPGCQYRICAGGSYRCNRRGECDSGMGCKSYVQGFNLSNFCVEGACSGHMCNGDAWGNRLMQSCANCRICGIFGADWGAMGGTGWKPGHGNCHCRRNMSVSGAGALMGMQYKNQGSDAWCICGCYASYPVGGGVSGISPFCGSAHKCCANGGSGGSGIVKITFS